MRTINLFFSCLLLINTIHLIGMKSTYKPNSNEANSLTLITLHEDISVTIIARCEHKDNLRKTCTYFRDFISNKKEEILLHKELILSEKALTSFLLYYGALGNGNIVRNLLSHGANPNACDDNKMSLMQHAAQYGYSDIITILLKHPDLITTKVTKDKNLSPCWLALQYNHPTIVKHILSKTPINWGEKALCYAINNELLDMVRTLLTCGIDANSKQKEHRHPLSLAAEYGNIAIMKLLIANKADVNCHCRYNNNYTPLHYASTQGHVLAVQFLLINHANVDALSSDNRTPLHCASQAIGKKDYKGHTITRTESEYVAIVKLLLNKGAKVNARTNCYHLTPLHYAAQNRYFIKDIYVAAILLEHGAEIDATATGYTPLHYAAQNGTPELAEILLEKGADINACTHTNYTALHFACENNHKLVETLLKYNANVAIKTNEGKTPYDLILYDDFIKQIVWEKMYPNNNKEYNCVVQ